MLELRPNCEACNKDLPPDSMEAFICSYECTFCEGCVTDLLHNVCPNCGGGFCPRPIRPQQDRRAGVSLQHQPASIERVNTRYRSEEIRAFSALTRDISPEHR